MRREREPKGQTVAYSDAPELHPGLIAGSVQLLFWLFFHPSAWRNHIARIDAGLRPGFCLAEVRREQWQDPAVRTLLTRIDAVWPFWLGLLLGVSLWTMGAPSDRVLFGVVYGVTTGVVTSIVVSATVSVAVGMGVGIAVGAAAGLAAGAADTGIAELIVSAAGGLETGTAEVVLSIVALGLGAGIGGAVAYAVLDQEPAHRSGRQMGGDLAAAVLGLASIGALFMVAFTVAFIFLTGVIPVRAGVVAIVATIGIAGLMRSTVTAGQARERRFYLWRRGVAAGLAGSAACIGLAAITAQAAGRHTQGSLVSGLRMGIAIGALAGSLWALSYVLTEYVAGPRAAVLAGALGGGGIGVALLIVARAAPLWPTWALSAAGILVGLTVSWWRPVALYPLLTAWNLWLYRRDKQSPAVRDSLLRRHSAFWDEHQRLPLLGLEDHLVLAVERDQVEGQKAMAYVAEGRQREAARAAQIELDARQLEGCQKIAEVRRAHSELAVGELEGSVSALLRSFSRISQDVDAALHQESSYNRRLALGAAEDRLDGLLLDLTRSSERYALRFRPIAALWRQVITEHRAELAQDAELGQTIDNPYVIGVPLTDQQEIFVGRADVSKRIEELLLDRRRPPLLLYGQRRMGKTSLLNNLGRSLPSTIVSLFVDLQGPASTASDHAGLLYNVGRGMARSAFRSSALSLPPLTRESLASDPFTHFDEWLDQVSLALEGRSALLALDEFEALDHAFSAGRFDEEAVLGTLRHLIQHRPGFKVLLSGSHGLDELRHWAGYLVNVQTVHIGYLKPDVARQLVERPVHDFALRYEPDASQRVLDLTRGHPFLTQLLCAEIVALKNGQAPAVRHLARRADVDAAVPEALQSGRFFFLDIQHNQVAPLGLAALRWIAAQGERAAVPREDLARQFPDEITRLLALLERRELIERVGEGYRFQVELIRRWFA
jgi:hypothetical protein